MDVNRDEKWECTEKEDKRFDPFHYNGNIVTLKEGKIPFVFNAEIESCHTKIRKYGIFLLKKRRCNYEHQKTNQITF